MSSPKDKSAFDLSRFDHVEEPRIRRILEHWFDLKVDKPMPSFQQLDPINISYALEIVWIVDVENEPRDFRYRLIGEHIRTAYAENIVGKTLRDIIDPDIEERVYGYYNRVVDEPAVVHIVGRVYAEDRQPARGERIILPLSDGEGDPGAVARLLGATIHSWADKGVPTGEVPEGQSRTFTPLDGRADWVETWLD